MSSWMGRCPGQGQHTGASKWQSTPPSAHTRSQTERGCETVTCTHVIRRHSPSLLRTQEHMQSRPSEHQVAGPWALQGEAGGWGAACRLRREAKPAGPPPATPTQGAWGSAPHANIPPARLYLSPPWGSHEGLKTQGGRRKERRRGGKKTKLSKEKYPRAARVLHQWPRDLT